MTNAGECCAKCVLILVNVIVMILSLVFLAAGIFIKVGGAYIDSFIKTIQSDIPKYTDSMGLEDSTATAASPTSEGPLSALSGYLNTAAIVLIVLGVVLFILSVLGCCGACLIQKCMLISYAVLVGIIFLGELICVILFFVGTFDPIIKEQLNITITEHFRGIDNFEPYSLLWNFVQIFFKCCGLNDYRDFDYAKNWNRIRTFNQNGVTYTVKLQTPVACCQYEGASFPPKAPSDANCSITPTEDNSNFQSGCLQAFGKEANTYFIIVCAVSLALQFLLVCFAIGLVCAARQDDEEGEESAKQDYNYTYGGHHQSRYPQQNDLMGKDQGYHYGQGYNSGGSSQGYGGGGYGGGGYGGGGYGQQNYQNKAYRY